MRKFCLQILTYFLFNNVQAQDYRLPLKELTDTFSNIHAAADKNGGFYPRMINASTWFTSPGNKVFTKTAFSLSESRKITLDSAARYIFSEVISFYLDTHNWDEFPGQPLKDSALFNRYLAPLCSCVTKAVSSPKKTYKAESAMEDCMAALSADSAYTNTMFRLLAGRPNEEIILIPEMAGRYALQHCSAMRIIFIDFLSTYSSGQFEHKLMENIRNADQTLYYLYQQNNWRETGIHFPAYKKYESHIIKALAIKEDSYLMSEQDGLGLKKGQLTFTRTYYKYSDNKPVLTGQVVFVTVKSNPASPLLSLLFTAPANIRNKEKIYKQLEAIEATEVEKPPPPREFQPGN